MRTMFRHLLFCSFLGLGAAANAQSFSVMHDTIAITTTTFGPDVAVDSVLNTTSSSIDIQWQVIATDFPTCWQDHSGMCEPFTCFQMSDLWPTNLHVTSYVPGYDRITLNTELASCTPGCYYLTARLNNAAIPTDTARITFIVCKPTPSKLTKITETKELALFPDPVTSVLNIEMGGADIRTVSIYNIIGRHIGTYHIDVTGPAMNVAHIPSGIYYARMLNEQGYVIATRKFTKQ